MMDGKGDSSLWSWDYGIEVDEWEDELEWEEGEFGVLGLFTIEF